MEGQKRMKRLTNHENTTPKKDQGEINEVAGNDLMDFRSSPDFPSSQECFSVGWDWSGKVTGTNRPSIRVVERPVQKRNNCVVLLECHRRRRLVRKYDPDMSDSSSFLDQLKSLASGLKRVPESTSPVASPPPSLKRREEHLITPTSKKGSSEKSSSFLDKVESSKSVTLTPSKKKSREELNDMLDDSLGADLLKFTQDLEQDMMLGETKTPKPLTRMPHNSSGSKKKNRLTLSTNKSPPKTVRIGVCRRINDVYEENKEKPASKSKIMGSESIVHNICKEEKKHTLNNNKFQPSIDFDDFDETSLLLTISEAEEKEMSKSQKLSACIKTSTSDGCSLQVKAEASGAKTSMGEDDDDFVSPDVLDMITLVEKKATQGEVCVPPKSMNQEGPCLFDWIDKQHETYLKDGENKNQQKKNQTPNRKKTLSLGKSSSKYTPEEIERKRQEAIKKRLQLKKK